MKFCHIPSLCDNFDRNLSIFKNWYILKKNVDNSVVNVLVDNQFTFIEKLNWIKIELFFVYLSFIISMLTGHFLSFENSNVPLFYFSEFFLTMIISKGYLSKLLSLLNKWLWRRAQNWQKIMVWWKISYCKQISPLFIKLLFSKYLYCEVNFISLKILLFF